MELCTYANNDRQWKEFLHTVPGDLVDCASIGQYKAGSMICLRDTAVKYIHMIVSGTVAAQNITFDGKVSNWINMPAPTFVGELEVMAERDCYAASVTALTDCVLLYWPVAKFMETALEHPQLLLLVTRVMAKKEYNLSVNRGQTAFRSPLEKTVMYLLRQYEADPPAPGSPYILRKTRGEISSEIFFSPKTLERCLYRLRDAGMLSILRGKVCISEEQLRLLEKFRDDPDFI